MKGNELDLATAVAVLNRFRHRGSDQWFVFWVQPGVPDPDWPVGGEDRYDRFSAFEAIAIAEKYLRNHETTPLDFSSASTHSDSPTSASATPHKK